MHNVLVTGDKISQDVAESSKKWMKLLFVNFLPWKFDGQYFYSFYGIWDKNRNNLWDLETPALKSD